MTPTSSIWSRRLQGPGFVNSAEDVKRMIMWFILFSAIWVYSFHMAVGRTTIAGAVAQWYFYRMDEDNDAGTGIHAKGWFFGRPVIYALGRVLRYHMGTMAFGSFIISLCTMPRIILEYVLAQTPQLENSNCLTRCVIWCLRCALTCFEKCVKLFTEFAYVNVAISGRNLCGAGRRTVELMVKYPAQVALDQLASTSLKVLACLLVPSFLVALSSIRVHKGWGACAAAIVGLSIVITRMAAGVFDIVLSSLFMCAMRDKELYNGTYASDSLSRAMGLSEGGRRASRRTSAARDIELS